MIDEVVWKDTCIKLTCYLSAKAVKHQSHVRRKMKQPRYCTSDITSERLISFVT